ncbi:MAG: HAD family hydrolase [Chitinispirillales bacterium]|jgi:phosphoglycolate phosphatase|nr:HAD family hydrolase [Chitinispirillales bacterium]
MIKGFVFDLDGTLLDTLDDIKDSLNRFLRNHNFALHSRESVKKMIGNGAKKLVERALPNQNFNDEEKELFCREYIKIYETTETIQSSTRIYYGMDEVLDCLTKKNCKIAVVTNKPNNIAQICRKKYLKPWKINPFFGQKENIPIKPDPFMLNKVIKLWNFDKSEVVFVGDSPEDILTAKNAGILGIGAGWGFRDIKILNEAGALCSPKTPKIFIEEIKKFGINF